jgi:beta-galactosidase
MRKITLTLLLIAIVGFAFAQQTLTRQILFNDDWKFALGDKSNAERSDFDDRQWRTLNLPHDWSIEGTFDEKNPAGVGGGALPGGVGWYRKTFVIPQSSEGKRIAIAFDGVYCNSEVWVNGNYLGKRPNGYISFQYDITKHLHRDGKVNVVAVKVDNAQQPNSRWYSGSGIYRNVYLITTNDVHVDQWGTFVRTSEVSGTKANVSVNTRVKNELGSAVDAKVTTLLISATNENIATNTVSVRISAASSQEVEQNFSVAQPQLWSLENPYQYTAKTRIEYNGKVVDEYVTPFGIRYFEFDAVKGFSLNGIHTKIRGVCLHHDLGCLGTAFNVRAMERQLEIMKGMGVNAVRTSHNPPAPQLLDLCDKMGILVMDEAFDMWKKEKNKFDYHLDWDAWHKRDLENLILRDRNHPSVIIWSVGNEIGEQWDTTGVRITKELVGIVKSLDATRPTVTANNEVKNNNLIKADVLDLIGYNYNHAAYENFPQDYPGKIFIATETTSALATRGHYDMPSDSVRRWPISWDKVFTQGNSDNTVSAYDNVSAPWGSTHEETWKIMKKHDFLSGMFIWTGFDYIGEPTPYVWPSRSSYFGVVDLAGFPKDVYYLYQSEWTNKPTLHIFPHWNWKPGQVVDVWAYYNQAEEVELFLNGKSLGVKSKKMDDLHVMWRVPFAAGTLKAISRKNGKEVLVTEVKTAGVPAKIILQADRSVIFADGKDLSFVTVTIVDAKGNVVPDADNLVKFTLSENAVIAGVDNGDPTSHASFKGSERKAFHGLALVVVRGKNKHGKVQLKASASGLEPAVVDIRLK